jgi:hypothetical protein
MTEGVAATKAVNQLVVLEPEQAAGSQPLELIAQMDANRISSAMHQKAPAAP